MKDTFYVQTKGILMLCHNSWIAEILFQALLGSVYLKLYAREHQKRIGNVGNNTVKRHNSYTLRTLG
jgi:hypothetical protein